jgi:pyrroline-5-carboxylate reductase
MIKVGFIGYGSMGSMLVESLIKSGRLSPDEIIVSTRTKSKLAKVKSCWDNIHIAEDNVEVARAAKYIFICVKPLEFKDILLEIKNYVGQDTNIISIAGPVPIKFIEELIHTKVTKLTPSLTSEVMEGISLVCHSNSVLENEADFIEGLLSGISKVKKIDEQDFELAAELTSCMPGFISAIFEEFAKSGLRHAGKMNKEDIEEMITRTLLGTAKLFIEKGMGFEDMVQRVATKGGITEEGVKVFNMKLPEVFDEMFKVTLNKRKIVKTNIELSFNKED